MFNLFTMTPYQRDAIKRAKRRAKGKKQRAKQVKQRAAFRAKLNRI